MRYRLLILGILTACAGLFAPSGSAAPPATLPASQPSLESKAVEKDGVSVKVTLKKPEITQGEQPQFIVRFSNMDDQYANLYGQGEYWDWKVQFTNQDKGVTEPGPWQVRVLAEFDSHAVATTTRLKPGDFIDVPVDLNNTGLPLDYTYTGQMDHLIASIKNLRPGTYKMVIEISLGPPPLIDTTVKYWTGPITTEPVELKVVAAGARSPGVLASPQELRAYNNAIDRLVKKLGSDGMWTNGLSPDIGLPADAMPEDVVAQAVKKSLSPEEIKVYRILRVREIKFDPPVGRAFAALIQTDARTRILIFYPFASTKGWWTRFYDADYTPPATRPSAVEHKPR